MNVIIRIATNPWSYLVLIIVGLILIYFLWKEAFNDNDK